MREVVGELARIGYFGAWRVLDSQFHGVPQRRRRVFGAFAPGSAGGWACGASVLLEPEGGGWAPAAGGEAGEDATYDTGEQPEIQCWYEHQFGGWRRGFGTLRSGNHSHVVTYVPRVAYSCGAQDAKGVSQREGQTTLVSACERGVRRLTPLECERLQGFPDGWTDVDGMSDTQRYRQLGNAVSVPVAYWIGLRARMALEANP